MKTKLHTYTIDCVLADGTQTEIEVRAYSDRLAEKTLRTAYSVEYAERVFTQAPSTHGDIQILRVTMSR